MRIVHSGLVYIHERNPRPLFEAIGRLKSEGRVDSSNFELTLRASGHEDTYSDWLKELRIEELVLLKPPLPYRQALQEMFDADGLLLLQGKGCNQQIPAKAYEYLRAQKPVLALTDEKGDTARLLIENNVAHIAPMDDADQIVEAIVQFTGSMDDSLNTTPDTSGLEQYSRENISSVWVNKIHSMLKDA